jgi:hypothetical protein
MAMGSDIVPSTQAYLERKLASVGHKRSHVPSADEIASLLAGMESPDEQVRAQAVRQVCPCRLPWEVFSQVRGAAKRLQHDPSPLVRANALHVEEDARELAALEALSAWTAEHAAGVRAIPRHLNRHTPRRKQSQWR